MKKLLYRIKSFFPQKEKNKPPVEFNNFTGEQYKYLLSKLKQEKRMLLEFETVEQERYGIKDNDDDIYIISEFKISIFFNRIFIKYKILQGNYTYNECLHFNLTKSFIPEEMEMEIDNDFDAFKYFIENIATGNCKIEILTESEQKSSTTKFEKIKEALYNYLKNEHDKKTYNLGVLPC